MKSVISKAEKENIQRHQNAVAKKRGNEALGKEMSMRDKTEFEKEMKKVQKKEGWEKIKEGMK